jgi:hypothetical protein
VPPTAENPRYDGQRLLRLAELYVLSAIDQLPSGRDENLTKMAPKLTELYGGDGTWQHAIARAMAFLPTLEENRRKLWAENTAEKTNVLAGPAAHRILERYSPGSGLSLRRRITNSTRRFFDQQLSACWRHSGLVSP